ncbi:2-hydroxyacyl-CoA lyase 1 [Trichinella spiralis]|uniref:2-hydroxyacyl-CoA lyase 1 n=1 Tax=Trichinella spiralis TaxID=6334 RepID=UPI0001EFB970|nr:2-hydroxyacyl-CoA lyase 1 [Trichinella spiralis]
MTYRSAESSKTTFSGIRTCGRFHCRSFISVEERSTAYGFADIIITITGVRMTNWILDIPKPTHQPSVEYEHADVSTADLNKTFLLFIINSRQIIAAI